MRGDRAGLASEVSTNRMWAAAAGIWGSFGTWDPAAHVPVPCWGPDPAAAACSEQLRSSQMPFVPRGCRGEDFSYSRGTEGTLGSCLQTVGGTHRQTKLSPPFTTIFRARVRHLSLCCQVWKRAELFAGTCSRNSGCSAPPGTVWALGMAKPAGTRGKTDC